MKLFGTPPSHFTRKVRVVLQELALPFDFVVLDRLMETGKENFAENPLHQHPVLLDGDRRLIESDLICEYLLEKHGKANPAISFLPAGDRFENLKRLALMNGGMGAGVKLIRAQRSGISWDYPFFRQESAALTASLDWLDQDLGNKDCFEEGKVTLLDITLMCFAEWAEFRKMIPSLGEYKNLRRFVETNKDRPSFSSTHPAGEAK